MRHKNTDRRACAWAIAACMALAACQGGSTMREEDFRQLETEKIIPLTSDKDAPTCRIDITVDELNDTGTVAGKINRTIAEAAFGGRPASLPTAIDSFCRTYGERYKRELANLYRADMKSKVSTDWYDYKYRISTEYKDGPDNGFCYLVHKTKYEGGAREYHEIQCLNFDRKTGKLIRLDDVFLPTYPALLQPLLLQELLSAFDCRDTDELHAKGILRLTDIYVPANFELGRDGITFIYNADEIAPFETGTVRLTVAYDQMKPFMKQTK